MSEPIPHTEAEIGPGTVRDAAANAMQPDPVTASLLSKHSAGERLSPAEYGKLSVWSRKLKAVFGGKTGNGSEPPPAGTGNAPGVGSLAPAAASADGLPAVPLDPGVCQRTTGAILRRLDAIGVRYIEREAARAGAEGATLARFRASAGLPKDDLALIVDLSPDVLAELGLDPRSYPLMTVVGVLGLHATNLWMCVNELKDLQRTKAEARSPKPEAKKGDTVL